MTFGNLPSQKILQDFFSQSRLRTIALTGPAHLGKASFARHLIQKDVHPTDYLLMEEGIDGVREALEFSRSEPLNGEYRVLLVDDAAILSEPAQDALLKICEEPRESMRLLLVAHDPGHLQPALRSRIRLESRWGLLSPSEMRSFAESLSAVVFDNLLSLSGGLPGIYQSLLEVGGLEDLYNDVRRMLSPGEKPFSRPTPNVIKDLKGRGPARDALVHILRAACRGSDPSRAVHVLRFCSTLISSPSANADIHWIRATAHISGVI